MASVSWAEVQV